MRCYLIMYYHPELGDWTFDIVLLSPDAVQGLLKDYERMGLEHPYEVEAKVKNPFIHYAKKFLDAHSEYYSERTFSNLVRRLNRQSREFVALWHEGHISSSDPRKITPDDILVFYNMLKGRGLKPSSISHELTVLGSLCIFLGNNAVDRFKVLYPIKPSPRAVQPVLSEDDFIHICNKGLQVAPDDFHLLRAFTASVVSLCSSSRSIENEFMQASHVDLENGRIFLERVKGSETYGKPRYIPIHPNGLEVLARYLNARRNMLDSKSIVSDVLFCSSLGGKLSENTLRKDRVKVNDITGIKFDIRTCRRSFGQLAIDGGLRMESLSVLMGHSSTNTTERYYARVRQGNALSEAKNIWEQYKS